MPKNLFGTMPKERTQNPPRVSATALACVRAQGSCHWERDNLQGGNQEVVEKLTLNRTGNNIRKGFLKIKIRMGKILVEQKNHNSTAVSTVLAKYLKLE
jgi:hypothetical protein